MNKLGYCSYEPEFARMARKGRSDRLLWLYLFELLEYSAKTGWLLGRETARLLSRLGLSKQEVGLSR